MANIGTQPSVPPKFRKSLSIIRSLSGDPTQNEYQLETEHGKQLIGGLVKLHDTKAYTDITLLVGGKRIAAHKVILAAFSPYFEALLNPNMQEGRRDEIELHHLNGDLVEKLVSFAYTGRISYSDEVVQDLLEVANFLDVKIIRKHCAIYIAKQIDSQNFVDVFALGRQLGEEVMFKSALKFFLYSFATLMMSEEFMRLPVEMLEEALNSENLQYYDSTVIPIPANHEHGLVKVVLGYVKHDIDSRISLLPGLLKRVRLPVIFRSVLLQLKDNSLIKQSAASLALVEKALSQGPVYVGSEDTELWRVPRQNGLLKKCLSRPFAGGGQCYNVVDRYEDSKHVPYSAHLVGMKIWMRRWDGRPIWGGYEAFYSNGRALKHGGDNFGFEVHEFHLEEGEVITSLNINCGWLIDQVTFKTNKGRVLGPYGGDGGGEHQNSHSGNNPNDGFLVCTQGSVVMTQEDKAITCLRFQWSHASPGEWSKDMEDNPTEPGNSSPSDDQDMTHYHDGYDDSDDNSYGNDDYRGLP